MPDLSRVAATNFRRNDGCRPENKNGPCPATTGWTTKEREGQKPHGADSLPGCISLQAWAKSNPRRGRNHEPAGHYNSRNIRATPASSAPVVQFWGRFLVLNMKTAKARG